MFLEVGEGRYRLKPPLFACREKCYALFSAALHYAELPWLALRASGSSDLALSKLKKRPQWVISLVLAEEGRFELPRQVTPAYSFSKAAPSATWVLLQVLSDYQYSMRYSAAPLVLRFGELEPQVLYYCC